MWIFIGLGTLSLTIAVVTCFFMDKKLEESSQVVISMSLWERIKLNSKDIYYGFRNREFHRTLIFFLIMNALNPALSGFFYYFLIDVAGITNEQLSILHIIKYSVLFVTVIVYAGFLKS